MKYIAWTAMLITIVFSFGLHLLGLMNIVPVFISGPVLFLSLLVFLVVLNDHKRFKGF